MLCIPLTILYIFAGKYLLCIFLDNPSGTAMDVGIEILHILAPFYIVVSTKLVADGVLRGAGMMNKFMIATFTDLILRVVLAKALSIPFGTTGIWLAWPIGWSVATVLSVLFYRTGIWRKNRIKITQ